MGDHYSDDADPGLGGVWYFLVTFLSFGILAWVPFAHGAARLQRRSLAVTSAVFGLVSALTITLFWIAPTDANDNPVGIGNVEIGTGVITLIALLGLGLTLQVPLRRQTYGGEFRRHRRKQRRLPAADPAVRAILNAREHRDEARALVAKDPMMAHELKIGRPDLKYRTYDDGGLVDLNAASATAIARTLELPPEVAKAIVAGRPYFTVDDVLTMVDIPVSDWPMIRDRGIVISLDGPG